MSFSSGMTRLRPRGANPKAPRQVSRRFSVFACVSFQCIRSSRKLAGQRIRLDPEPPRLPDDLATSGTEARSDLYAEPPKMVPQSGTLNMFDQRSSDSPSPTPGISPSANQYGVAPYGVTSLHPSPSPSNRSTLENLARQNFVRMQASKIPDAVDLLEAYIREPKAVFKVNLNGPSVHQSDPLIQQYGLSMFVDYYCPDEEVAPNGTTFDEAEAILAKFKHYLNNDLLLATDLGSTRQISASPSISKQKMRSGLVVCAVIVLTKLAVTCLVLVSCLRDLGELTYAVP